MSVSLPPPWGHPDHPWVLGRVWVQLGVGGHQGRVRYGDTLGTGMQQAWGHPVVHPRRGDTLDAVMGAPRSPVWHPWVQPAGSVTLLVPRPPQGHRWGLSQAVSPPAKPRDVGRKLWVLAGPSEAHPQGRGTSGPPLPRALSAGTPVGRAQWCRGDDVRQHRAQPAQGRAEMGAGAWRQGR